MKIRAIRACPARGAVRVHVAGAVRSLVNVRFAGWGRPLTYLNERFALHVGDVVYVSGKLAGEPGVVTAVITKFRVPTATYERVLALLDLRVHGEFFRVQDKMVCLDAAALPPQRFAGWVTAPNDPLRTPPEMASENSLVSGGGYTIDLADIDGCADITDAIANRAADYLQAGRVRYLVLQNGVGCAYVEGTQWYRVDFCCRDGALTELYCTCPYPALCKHEVAVAQTLRALLAQPQIGAASGFIALDHTAFWHLASRAERITL